MDALSQRVLEANENHKDALDQYTSKLQADLNAVDKLIAAVEELPEDDLQEDPGDKWCLHVAGAFKPTGIIDLTQTVDEKSPFHDDAVKRDRYMKSITPNPFNGSEKRYLEKAVVKENQRLAAIRAQRSGQSAFEAVACDNKFFLDNTEGIDWTSVARDVSASNYPLGSRADQECRVRWLGAQHPKTNTGEWTDDEEKRLLELIETKRGSGLDWEEIARLLDTRRSPLDCVRRFHTSSRSTFRWTAVLDDKLLSAVRKHGSNNWALVASSVSLEVSANQCQIRYGRTLNPEIRRGKFSQEEDERLLEAIEAHGSDWVKVAQAVPGRTNAQCRDRYMNYLTGGIVKAPWAQEEDAKLRGAVAKHGNKWEKVREEMGRVRSKTQYATRYRILLRWDAQDAAARSSEGIDAASEPHAGPSSSDFPEQGTSASAAASQGGTVEHEESTSTPVPALPGKGEMVSSTPRGRGRGKGTGSRGRKKKAAAPRPELETGTQENAEHEMTADSTAASTQQTTLSKGVPDTAKSKGKSSTRGRKRKVAELQPEAEMGGVTSQGDDASTSAPKKRPRARPIPKPRATARQASADASAEGAYSIPPLLSTNGGSADSKEGPPPVGTTQNETSKGKGTNPREVDPRTQAAMGGATSDLSDLTDLEDAPTPKKKAQTKAKVAKVAKTVTEGSLVRKSSATSSSTPKRPLATRTMRTRSSTRNIVAAENSDVEMTPTGEPSGRS